MRSLRTNLINPLSAARAELLQDYVISIEAGIISALEPYDPALHPDAEDHRHQICSPGFIDLHVHLAQYRIRGNYRPALLPWLQEVVYPEEAKSRESAFACQLSADFFQALLQAGTTTAVIYTAPFKEATEIAFEAASQAGIRALIGMTLMDRNSPPELIQSTSQAFEDSVSLYEHWHNANPRLDYIFTPRFAPTCSAELMKLVADFARPRQAWIQTHLAENYDEIKWVQELFTSDSYTAVYESYGLLSPHTILAHAIHLRDEELAILKEYDCRIAHCPDSNFYLKSGEFPLSRIKAAGLKIALGSDVGAGTTLRMPHHAKMMNFRASSLPVLPSEAFYSMTLGAAKALHQESSIGSLSVGKSADLILLESPDEMAFDEHSLSRLIFYGCEYKVVETIVAGKVISSGLHTSRVRVVSDCTRPVCARGV